MTLREIYDEKIKSRENPNIDQFANILSDNNPDLYITNNCDRSFLLQYETQDILNDTLSNIHIVFNNWLEDKSECNCKYLYNLLPLNSSQSMLII